MTEKNPLDDLVDAVISGAAYRQISPGLVKALARQELAKGRPYKAVVRAVRSRLHQAAGAFQSTNMEYQGWMKELDGLEGRLESPELQGFCRKVMESHASTCERLADLEQFYRQTLASVGPISSLLDLACGLNPLSLPWMNLAPDVEIFACDIYANLAEFINHFFAHTGLNGSCGVCDLTTAIPDQPVQVALLLKSIPCLEQLDKNCIPRLLEGIRAEYLLVSFPAHSLGGRSKGMPQHYEKHFTELMVGRNWKTERFWFSSEIAYLIRK